MRLTVSEEQYWQSYLDTLQPSGRPQEPVVTAGYAGGSDITDELVQLYLDAGKTAGSSLLDDFLTAKDPVPQVGDYWICLGGDGEPRCILRTVKVERHQFNEIPHEIALAEGEGDRSVACWKRAHADRYAPHLEAWGIGDLDEAIVVTEFFQIVFRSG